MLPVSGYGSDSVGVEQHYVPTRVSPSSRNNRGHKENKTQTVRQRSKLAETSQEGEKGRERTQGGRSKKIFLFNKKTKTIGGRVKGAKLGSKRLNHVC